MFDTKKDKHHVNILLSDRSHLTARQSMEAIISYARYTLKHTDKRTKRSWMRSWGRPRQIGSSGSLCCFHLCYTLATYRTIHAERSIRILEKHLSREQHTESSHWRSLQQPAGVHAPIDLPGGEGEKKTRCWAQDQPGITRALQEMIPGQIASYWLRRWRITSSQLGMHIVQHEFSHYSIII